MTAWGVLLAGILYLIDAARCWRDDPWMAGALCLWFCANLCLAGKMYFR